MGDSVVQEYRRTCKGCGKVWHSLVGKEDYLRQKLGANAAQIAAGCGSPSTASQGMATGQLISADLAKLRTCPECGSSNYAEEVVDYDEPSAG
jgi:hypothetical protein